MEMMRVERQSQERAERKRIPSLDGLRAISIVLVIAGHACWTNPRLRAMHHFALLGVRVFFVISGFLITEILRTEWLDTERVDLWNFYRHRFWRLMPAFYVYLFFVAVMATIESWPLHLRDFLYFGFYLMNYYPGGGPWVLGHLWSLAVEEQFYFVWPIVFYVATPHRARGALVVALLLAPAARVMLFPWRDALGDVYGTMFPSVCDALATGCLFALQRQRMHTSGRYLQFLRSNAYFLLLPLCAGFQLALAPRLSAMLGPVGMNLAICVLIDGCITFPRTLLTGLLNNRAVMLVGRMSYSLYLWQQPFLFPEARGGGSVCLSAWR